MTKFMISPANLFSALTLSFLQIVSVISFAAFLFGGSLAEYTVTAVYPILLGAIICQLVTSCFSSLPIAMSPPQDEPIPVYGLLVTGLVVSISITQDRFPTVILAVGLATLLTGLIFFLVGYFKLGNIVRFVPYPVIAGYLAGIGWLIISQSLNNCLPNQLVIEKLGILFSTPYVLSWLPVIAFAVLLYWINKCYHGSFIFPGLMIAYLIGFYAIVYVADLSMDTLRAHRFLFEGQHPVNALDYFQKIVLADIDWHAIVTQLGKMALIVVLSSFSLLLLATSLEHELKQDLDFNKELCVAGIGNMLAGMIGGLCSYIAVVDTLLNSRMKTNSRAVGLMTAGISLLFFIFGIRLISYIPRSLLFGLMLYLGFMLLKHWLYDIRFMLRRIDYVLVLSILIVVAVFGLLQGVLIGIAATILVFVINFSRTSAVKYYLTGKKIHSNQSRDATSQSILEENGDELLYVKLQGYIFFGSSYLLVDFVSKLIDQFKKKVKFLIIDFERVFDVDTSACSSFEKMARDAETYNYTLVLAEPNPTIKNKFLTIGLIKNYSKHVVIIPCYDRALAWCEKQIITRHKGSIRTPRADKQFFVYDQNLWEQFAHYFETVTLAKNNYLFHQGDRVTDLYYVKSGKLSLFVTTPEGIQRRVAICSNGHTFGNVSMNLNVPRPISIKALGDCVLMKLSKEQLLKMERENPKLALDFYKASQHHLSELVLLAYNQLGILYS